MTEVLKTAKDISDGMVKGLRAGKEIHELFANTIRTGILIQGRTMEQWSKHFSVNIPDVADTTDCKSLDLALMKLHEEATFLKCMAEASNTLGRKSYDTQYREKFTALVSEYKQADKKLPAKDTLEILASHDLDDIEASLSYSELAIKFWKDVLEDLNFKRRAVETLIIGLSVEAKANQASTNLQNRRE